MPFKLFSFIEINIPYKVIKTDVSANRLIVTGLSFIKKLMNNKFRW